MNRHIRHFAVVAIAALAGAGCAGSPTAPIETVPHVDLARFMGAWYVIANIPTPLEKGAHNAVERYALAPDGNVDITFTFRADAFDGKPREYHPRGIIENTATNAHWGIAFGWPFRADYRIAYLDPGYTQTVIARERRDWVWIMARTPQISDADYARLVALIARLGYDTTQLEKVPQRWPQPASAAAAPATVTAPLPVHSLSASSSDYPVVKP